MSSEVVPALSIKSSLVEVSAVGQFAIVALIVLVLLVVVSRVWVRRAR